MATHKGKVHLAICLVLGISCLLPFVSCVTTTADETQNQTSYDVTTSPFQRSTVQSIVDITTKIQLADEGTTAATETYSCDTTLENGPTNMTQFEGERVSLTCDFNNNNTRNILWKFSNESGNWRTITNNSYIYPSDNVNNKIIIRKVRQIYRLVFKSISLHRDAGIYECGYECVSGGNFIPLASTMITVLTWPHCELHPLPPSRSDEEREFEVVCSWTSRQVGFAHFENSRDTIVAIDLNFTDRIISRMKSKDTPNITCLFTSSRDAYNTTTAPCTITTGLVRVEPFINEVAIGSNASFVCSSNNQTYSWAYWYIGFDRILHNGSKDRVFENGNTLSIVNVSESDESLVVECSLQVPGTEKIISSYGTLRIAEMTTPYLQTQDYDNPTYSATDGISESTHEISQSSSRPTVVTHTSPLATQEGVGPQQTTVAPICKLYKLPSVRLPLDRDYEVVCSWTHSQVNRAHFERSSGEIIDGDIKFPDHIIGRVNSSVAKNIFCRLSLNTNPSSTITTPCIHDGIPRLIRVDPFIGEVNVGSTVVFYCTFNNGRSRSGLSWKVNSGGNASLANAEQKNVHRDVTLVVHEHEGKHYLLVECHIQLSSLYNYENSSSYGALHVVEATTPKPPTTPGEGRTSEIMYSPSHGTVELKTDRNTFIKTQPRVEVTTPKLSSKVGQITDKRTVRTDGFTTDQTSIISNQPTAPSKQGIMLTVIISVVIALIILLLVSAVFCFLRKRKRISSQHRLSNDGKAGTIELSNIPHIMHEESSEWYALSFKDKRLHQSDDSEVLHHDEDKVNNVFSSSLGILTLHPSSEFTDETVYAEPGPADAAEEPLRQTISRQQCTFTPLIDSDK